MTALAGQCFDIDGNTWHKDGERCRSCGFGHACHYCKRPIDDHHGVYHGFVVGVEAWRHPECPETSNPPRREE